MPKAQAWLGLALASIASAQSPEILPPFGVTAARSSRPASEQAAFARVLAAADLPHFVALDRALRADPAFSLFRRSDSLSAHPTAQGVSLRGIGPSGASRSLVLLDGVPLNDPFGGWVIWNQMPALGLASAEISRGGNSAAWGNSALSGTIALVPAPVARAGSVFALEGGTRDTWLAELSTGAANPTLALRVDARAFTTDGFHPLDARDRGPIDVPLSSEHRAIQLRAQRQFGPIESTLTLRHYEEDRVNGTLGQTNATTLDFASLTLRGHTRSALEWQLMLYGQDQQLRSTFSSASLDRVSETPANNQFEVPVTAAGGAFTIERRSEGGRTNAGVDFRRVRGETREDFLFANGAFTRRRFAGGAQTLGGVFLAHDRRLAENWRGSVALRADRWELTDGLRRESNLLTGTPTRADLFPDRKDTTGNANLGLIWTPREEWRVRFSTYRAFRVPTLNELYRPFRVGNVNTEANATLREETLHGAEIGTDFHSRIADVSFTAFANQLNDAVGNVTLATTPTLVSRERRNLDRIEIRGAELRARWTPAASLALDLAWLYSASEITRATAQPNLQGKRLAQSPRQVATASIGWEFWPNWSLQAATRWTDRQFEDDENTLILGRAATLDLRIIGRLTERSTLTLALDNATDEAVPVARAANGLTSYAAPRAWRLGWRQTW